MPIWLLNCVKAYVTLDLTKTEKILKSADTVGVTHMEYQKVKQAIERIPEDCILNRQEVLKLAMDVDLGFKETLLRNLLQKLLDEGDLIRIGRNQYQKIGGKNCKERYRNQYSQEAQLVVDFMKKKYPLLDYRVWEIKWLNEFWNHQIAQNKIFVEVERMGCDFVYTELSEEYTGNILLRPNEKELYRYGGMNTIIVDRLVSESPKGNPEKYNTPLEKLIVDLFANKNLKEMVHIGEYEEAMAEMFDKYYVDQIKLFRYAARRNRKEEIYHFLKEQAGVEIITER